MPENVITAGSEQAKYFPYSDKFHLTRNTFWAAGQDSFTSAPAQNSDLFELLYNVEPVFQGTLKRRRGYQLLSHQSPITPYLLGYSFRSENLSLRELVWTSKQNVLILNEDGSTAIPTLFTPSMGATFSPRMVLSRSYGYFADGGASDYLKWDGTNNTGNLTNWGISNQGSSSSSTTLNGPSSVVNQGGGTFPWNDPTNIEVQDSNYATTTVVWTSSGITTSSTLLAEGFGFSVPSNATITDIAVTIVGYALSGSSPFSGMLANVNLVKGGAGVGAAGFTGVPPGPSEGSATITGSSFPSDPLWNSAWTPTDINDPTFGLQIRFYPENAGLGGTVGLFIDFVGVQVFYSTTGISATPTGSGNVTLLNGRVYSMVYLHSATGTTSDLIPFSITTGPVTSQVIDLSNIPISPDPQVDFKILLATADGGDETTLFFLDEIPNSQTTYTDNTPDALSAAVTSGPFLLGANVYQETQSDGTLHGVANNKVPPQLDFPIKHKGRIYGSIQNTLFFSKNLVDVTTSTGTITSKWEEAWPASNRLDISETSETIQGLLSDGETLWIGTERCIRRLVGDSPANFQEPEIQFNETGLLNQDVWKVCFSEGQPIGTMWMTPDLRIMASDFNTYQDVGTPVQNILNTLNRNAAVPPHACFYSKGPAEYYLLHIPTGTNASPDTVLVFNMRSKTWCIWMPSDEITASLFLIDAMGNSRWTFASLTSNFYEWMDGLFQDRVNNTPVLYNAEVLTSWLDFGDSTLRKALNQIIIGTSDSTLKLDIQGAITDVQLDAGVSAPMVITNASLTTGPLGDLFVPLAGSVTKYRWYKFAFKSNVNTTQDILDFYNVESIPLHRW